MSHIKTRVAMRHGPSLVVEGIDGSSDLGMHLAAQYETPDGANEMTDAAATAIREGIPLFVRPEGAVYNVMSWASPFPNCVASVSTEAF